jgi:hypothetical protein
MSPINEEVIGGIPDPEKARNEQVPPVTRREAAHLLQVELGLGSRRNRALLYQEDHQNRQQTGDNGDEENPAQVALK